MTLRFNRRAAMRHGASVAIGAAAGAAGVKAAQAIESSGPLPFYSGPAASIHADRRTPPRHDTVTTVWSVRTDRKLIALTFDDGPKPLWTPRVLETLKRNETPATFFVVGQNLTQHAALLDGQTDRHEFANHTWEHRDLARQDLSGAMNALRRTHEAIVKYTGQTPSLMRPPYGHIAGSTMLACAEFGYTIVLWSRQMVESDYLDHPPGLVDYIVSSAAGDIVLAHDTGPQDRLVAIANLDAMIKGLRDRGFTFVTVSELLGSSAA